MKQENKNIIFLVLILSGFWVLMPLTSENFSFNSLWVKRTLRLILSITFIVIINVKFLMPRFYFRKQTMLYFLISAAFIIVTMLFVELFVDPYFELTKVKQGAARKGSELGHYFRRILPFVVTQIGSTLFEVSRFADEKEKEALLLRSEKTEAEMKMLKSQINPHFLFNALNNIYSLSYLKPEKTPENLLKLSQILRYMLYECNEKFVPLQQEIVSLENFIDLNMLKDSRGMQVKVNLETPSRPLQIAPMLLMPFVENAFKHAKIEDLENGWIMIDLKTKNERLIFRTENSIPSVKHTKDKVGGIGLKNVKRRLNLIYPKKSQLNISTENDTYTVHLEIELT